VAIINAPLAARLWPHGDALGQCMRLDNVSATCVRVVGVMAGFWKMHVLERDRMAVYLPLAQVPSTIPGILFVRSRVAPDVATPGIRAVVQTLRPDLPAANIVLMRDLVEPQFRPLRLGASVFSAFAAVALLIAMIGLYGVVAAATALRVKEIGVRIALGARRGDVVRTVAGEGVPAVLAGFAVGAALITVASRWFDGVLFETSPGDAAVILQTAIPLLAVALLALMVPSVRALRTNPADVLRSE
jgi:ABC-type antimicrobial peptide transport system permease subunit